MTDPSGVGAGNAHRRERAPVGNALAVPGAAPCRRIDLSGLDAPRRRRALEQEWLVTNGLGGYASGTIAGRPARRHHGLLVAALPSPAGRRLLIPHLDDRLRLPDGSCAKLAGTVQERPEALLPEADYIAEFRLDAGLPVWRYELAVGTIEKRILMMHGRNTVHVIYRLLDGADPVRLELRVYAHRRSHDDPVDTPVPRSSRIVEQNGRVEIDLGDELRLRLGVHGARAALTVERSLLTATYPIEAARGYPDRGELWSPGYLSANLASGWPVSLTASTEGWTDIEALPPEDAERAERSRRRRLVAAAPPAARQGLAAELVLAADQFIAEPVGRIADALRMTAEGDEVRTVIAGYPWFTDWGRDTMISLDGLTLATGRGAEAGLVLRLFAHYVRDGLIPNMFPEGAEQGLYHTADATLWFFHALDRYVDATTDSSILDELLPVLVDIVEHHVRGTRFGIGVDASDGLLRQGVQGYQLTWMDAKVDDWVVTPRRGKAVEINALWYNALCLLERWLRDAGREGEADRCAARAESARQSFNRRFWFADGGYLYDVVDGEQGDDPSFRPNQIFAIALPHAVLDASRWREVLDRVRRRLLTPVGLRTLSPDHPDYRAEYSGDLRSRDAAYHQGTVWPWLLGPFVDAWLRTYPADVDTARSFVAGFDAHLGEGCIGSISEIFDAEAPFTPRGCIAQAWSVAEVLRCLVATAR